MTNERPDPTPEQPEPEPYPPGMDPEVAAEVERRLRLMLDTPIIDRYPFEPRNNARRCMSPETCEDPACPATNLHVEATGALLVALRLLDMAYDANREVYPDENDCRSRGCTDPECDWGRRLLAYLGAARVHLIRSFHAATMPIVKNHHMGHRFIIPEIVELSYRLARHPLPTGPDGSSLMPGRKSPPPSAN